MSPAIPFAAARDGALRASADLQAIFAGPVLVFTVPPQNQQPPYVVVGEDEVDDLSEDCGEAHSILSVIQWWADDPITARAMGVAIVAALKVELAIEGHATVLVAMDEPERYATDPDGSSRGRVAFRYETTALD